MPLGVMGSALHIQAGCMYVWFTYQSHRQSPGGPCHRSQRGTDGGRGSSEVRYLLVRRHQVWLDMAKQQQGRLWCTGCKISTAVPLKAALC